MFFAYSLATSVVARLNQVTPQLCSCQLYFLQRKILKTKSLNSNADTHNCTCVIIELSRKRKQQLSSLYMYARAAKSH